jgi:preprotein translocase subunit YajC
MLDMLSASAAAGGAPGWVQFAPIVGMVVIFWFLIIRPQMRQQKEHKAKVSSMKRGDQVVTGGGLVGKVVKVDDIYVEIEIAQGVKVKAVKQTIADLISPTGTPAND